MLRFAAPGLSLLFLAALVACVDNKAALGAPCVKNDDCQTAVCTALFCASAGPLEDAARPADAGEPEPGDAAADATEDADADS